MFSQTFFFVPGWLESPEKKGEDAGYLHFLFYRMGLKVIHVEFVKTLALSPARWHSKNTCLSSLGMLGTTQLNFICRSHNIYDEHMKCTHTRQRTTNNNTNNKKRTSLIVPEPSSQI